MPAKMPTVPYHRQEGTNYCGAACLKMVIEALGGPSKDQDDLYLDAHASGTKDAGVNWFSAPDGIEATLDAVKKLPQDFDLVSFTQEPALTRRLVWSMFNAGVPPIALVYGFTHWVVVVGYDTSQDPDSPTDTGYTISALEIHDPWRADGEGDPPPPPPPRHVTYTEWLNKYLKPVPRGYWAGKVVAIGEFAGPKRKVKKIGEMKPMSMGSTSAPIISPDEAKKGAVDGVERYRLRARAGWEPLLVPSAVPLEPVLVQRLDLVGDYYYLVPFGAGQRKVVEAVVRVDAFSGEYLEATAVASDREGRPWSRVIADAANEELTRRRMVGRRFELPGNAGRILARPQGVGVHPSLVWRPCVESLSPYYPFRLLTLGNDRRYIRIDGAEFAELHDAGPGM